LLEIDPDILVYGEHWTLNTSTYGVVNLATQANLFKDNMEGIAAFSDAIRDAVRGGVFNAADAGWVQNSAPSSSLATTLKKSLKGGIGAYVNPNQLVNYISAHDNNTLFDKLLSSGVEEVDAPKVSAQGSAIVTFAQGVPFYHAGDELMRQKINSDGSFNHNSYNASDELNSLKWDRKVTYNDEFNKYKEMITLRGEHALFRNSSSAEITANYTELTAFGGYTFTAGTVGYKLVRGVGIVDDWAEAIVLHNGNIGNITVNATGYSVGFVSDGNLAASSNMVIPSNVSVVLYK